MQKYRNMLLRLGMSEYEVSIYLTLLLSGPKNISDIARETGHHRPLVYKVIRTLRERGYITTVPSSTKRVSYSVSDPQLLLIEVEKLQKQTLPLIDELVSIYRRDSDHPRLTIQEGIDGIRSIHDDLVRSLPQGGIYYRYSSSQRDYAERSRFVPEEYFDLQNSKSLERYIITNEVMRERRSDNPLREVVAIPKEYDLFDDNTTKLIYGDTVAIIDYDALMGWTIKSARFAEYERKIFMLLFRLLQRGRWKA